MRQRLAILVAVALLARAGSAFAQSDDDRVRALSAQALQHYNLAEYDKAIAKFKQAYRLRALPEFLYNIAQAHRLAKHCRQALQVYKSYLREAPHARNRAKVLEHIEAMRACAATQPLARAPAHKPEPVKKPTSQPKPKPPAPEPTVRPRPVARARLTSPPTIEVESPRPPGRVATLAGVGVVTTGVAAAVLAYAFSRNAADAERRISERFVEGGEWQPADAALEQDGMRSARRARWSLATSGALVVSGAVLIYLGRRRHSSESRFGVSASPDGATVMWSRAW